MNVIDIEHDVPTHRGPWRDLFEGACLMCSRQQGEWMLSEAEARRKVLLGLPKCRVCGGLVSLTRTFGLQVASRT